MTCHNTHTTVLISQPCLNGLGPFCQVFKLALKSISNPLWHIVWNEIKHELRALPLDRLSASLKFQKCISPCKSIPQYSFSLFLTHCHYSLPRSFMPQQEHVILFSFVCLLISLHYYIWANTELGEKEREYRLWEHRLWNISVWGVSLKCVLLHNQDWE